MAKFNNPLEQMANMPEPNRPQPPKPGARPAARPPHKFENPLEQVSDIETGKATASSLIAGQYIRRTFTLTPGQLRRIRQIARELHVAETAIARWLIDEGLAQWEQGVRPELETREVKLEPKLRDW